MDWPKKGKECRPLFSRYEKPLPLSKSTDILGGGYVMPLSKGHLDWMTHVRNEAISAGVELSVCILAYGRFTICD